MLQMTSRKTSAISRRQASKGAFFASMKAMNSG